MIAKFNSIGAILIAAILIYGSTNKSWVYFSYEVNKLEIIEKFCVKKEVEEYTCEGKCHLMNQLNEAEEESPFNEQAQSNQEEITVLFKVYFQDLNLNYNPDKISLYPRVDLNYLFQYNNILFRPPIA